MRLLPRSRRQWITKHSSGFCAVGRMAQRMGLRPNDECPRCSEPESAEHVWRCQHPGTNALWEDSMQQLRQVLGRVQTPQSTINAIIEGLDGWRVGKDTVFNTRTTAGKAGVAQSELGWRHMLEGRPHKMWREIQAKHCEELGIRQSSRRWVSALITKMLEIAWDLWEHRNGILHDKEKGYAAQMVRQQILILWNHSRIQHITSIRQLVKGNVEDILCSGYNQQQQWILRVEAAINKDKRLRGASQYSREREGMRRYLEQFKRKKKKKNFTTW
jgi:hypothetical protein